MLSIIFILISIEKYTWSNGYGFFLIFSKRWTIWGECFVPCTVFPWYIGFLFSETDKLSLCLGKLRYSANDYFYLSRINIFCKACVEQENIEMFTYYRYPQSLLVYYKNKVSQNIIYCWVQKFSVLVSLAVPSSFSMSVVFTIADIWIV